MVEVELLVKGESFDPATLTAVLGAGTRSKRKGEVSRTSTGHEVKSKIGLWALAPGREDPLSDQIEFLVRLLRSANIALGEFPGVEEVVVDIFILLPTDDPDSKQHVFEFMPDQLSVIGAAGAKISLSIGLTSS
jgi:hypothetical protein